MAKRRKKPELVDSEHFGPIKKRRDSSFYGDIDWMGKSVSISFEDDKDDLAGLLEIAKTLVLDQVKWDKDLKKYLKAKIMAGAARYLFPAKLDKHLLASLYLAMIFVAPDDKDSDNLWMDFSYFSDDPNFEPPKGLTDYAFHVNASIRTGIRSFEIRGGD